MSETIVHLIRHGQVENPEGILYGRLPGYHLSKLGQQMAERVGEFFADVPLTHLRCSPLERAQETMAPIARRHPDLDVVTDERVIEADNKFEGHVFGANNKALFNPKMFWHMRNPLRPSWGEPYKEIAARMHAAMDAAREAAGDGGQAAIVSHQLAIWMARRFAEGRSLVHDPRARECRLASVTSFTYRGGRIIKIDYTEPAKDLLPHTTRRKFKVGT